MLGMLQQVVYDKFPNFDRYVCVCVYHNAFIVKFNKEGEIFSILTILWIYHIAWKNSIGKWITIIFQMCKQWCQL